MKIWLKANGRRLLCLHDQACHKTSDCTLHSDIKLGRDLSGGRRKAKDYRVRLAAAESSCVVGVERAAELVGAV